MQFYFSCTNNSHQYNVLFIAVDDLNDWVGFMDGNQQTRTLLDLCDLPLKKTNEGRSITSVLKNPNNSFKTPYANPSSKLLFAINFLYIIFLESAQTVPTLAFLNFATGKSVAIVNSSASILLNCDLTRPFKYLFIVGLINLKFFNLA